MENLLTIKEKIEALTKEANDLIIRSQTRIISNCNWKKKEEKKD